MARVVTRKQGHFPGRSCLVLQGGGALGAYQVGLYEAMSLFVGHCAG